MLTQQPLACRLVLVTDPMVLQARALRLRLPFQAPPWQGRDAATSPVAILPVDTAAPVQAGKLEPANAAYVVKTLERATDGCLSGEFDALVTAPVHKGVINDAGIAFTGHTEYLASRTGVNQAVMMLMADQVRVALVTTHVPLADVSRLITATRVIGVIRVLHRDLQRRFHIENPRILVCGLNPHAGESGHLGREEIEVIAPAIEALRDEGLHLTGPVPADTAFTPDKLLSVDAVLTMYHDQGLPVLKHLGFGHAVNITLGLPFIRTSVDHGTALDLAGTGRADPGSLRAAVVTAVSLLTS